MADELSERHEVTVFANRCERPADARWDFQPVRAWRGNALATVRTFPIGLRSLATKLAAFDIRHSQGYCGGQPNVVTAHICLAAYLDSLRDISLQSRTSLRLMAAAEARFYSRYEGRVIAVSQKTADELQNFYEVRGPISVIPHGVDATRFSNENRGRDRASARRQVGVNDGDTLALYVGDLTKSHSYLKELSAAAPDVQFAIVTASPAYHWKGANVRLIPPTSEIERYYAAADAFVFPTTYDAFGMVVLEAMASGLPVFSSDRAGAAELIESGKDGLVFPLDEWVEATAAALRNPESLRSVGCEAEQTARRHDWSTVVAAVEQVYFQVAGCVSENDTENANANRHERATTRGHSAGSLTDSLRPGASSEQESTASSHRPMTTVAFIVNGNYETAMGYRARDLAARLGQFDVLIAYRSTRKIVSILSFFIFLVRARPKVTYVFDISYSGVLAAALYRIVFGNRLVVETGDAIVELARSTGSRGRLRLWLTSVLENTAFRIADRVVV
ncbi:MAG: glycosyltransferase family 4 protein, partial [Acidobacteria bacterium]|nr:glycosyltransferase family 4 protein [Acidobacteriota bacterium]